MAKKWKNVPYTGSVLEAIEGAVSEIETLKDEMEQWRDGMEEKLSHTDKYQEVSDACDVLEEAYDKLQGIELPEGFDPQITYIETKPYGKKPEPRWMRWSNVQTMLAAALEAVQDREHVAVKPEGEEDDTDWDEIENSLDEASNLDVNFPGMY